MKKLSLVCLFGLVLLFALNANAQQGGFTGPTASPTTVAKAINMRDDAIVTLQGQIVRHLGGEKYMFQDNTGNITVDIDNSIWQNISVDQNDKVEISGEIDREARKVQVNVETIKKL